MNKSIKKGSENYAAQVIKLPTKVPVQGLDNLVQVTYQGNNCLISKDSVEDVKYLFFPAGCELNEEFLSKNNLYRHTDKNADTEKSGFFEDNGRVKALKFKGVISTGFIVPLESILGLWPKLDLSQFEVGDSFTTVDKVDLCWKYIKPVKGANLGGSKQSKLIDEIVDSKMFPEHFQTSHLLANVHQLKLTDNISLSVKLHGTSVRISNSLINRKLSFIERVAKFLGAKVQDKEYAFLVGSRRVLKSVNGQTLGKKGYYASDIWTKVAMEQLYGRLNEGEAIYGEIIGSDNGSPVQSGYSYGLNHLKLYIYRITNINSQGIEVDLFWDQMKQRAEQLGVEVVPEVFQGNFATFIESQSDWWAGDKGIAINIALEEIFYNKLLEKPSILDKSVVEEGLVLRVDGYPHPKVFKIKSRKFLALESKNLDKGVDDIEEGN